MPLVKAAIGNREVIGGGSLVLGEDQLTFELHVENLTLEFIFIPGEGEMAVTPLPVDSPTRIKVELKNFDNPLGTTFVSDKIGDLNGKALFLSLYIQAVKGKFVTRLVNYTLMTGAWP